jgi:hypothetical protein
MNKEEYNIKFAELSNQIRKLDAKRADLTSEYIKQNAEYQPGDKVRARQKHLAFGGVGSETNYECSRVQVSTGGNFKYFFKEVGSRVVTGYTLNELEILEKL